MSFVRRAVVAALLSLPALAVLLPAAALAVPTLREASGGEVPDDVRTAVRGALVTEVPFLGERALAPRPYAAAQLRLQEVAQRFPTSAAVQRSLAQVAFAAGDSSAAEAAYQRAATLSQGASWALDDLARFYAARGQVAQQVATLERLAARLVEESRRPGGQHRRAEVRKVYERIIAALGVKRVGDPHRYRQALVRLFPDDAAALRQYVDELVTAGQERALRRVVTATLKRHPEQAPYLTRTLASFLESRRDLDGAILVYTKLLGRTPVPVAASGVYGNYLDLLDRNLRLRPVRRELILKARRQPLAGTELATLVFLHLRDGKGTAARALLERVRDQDPGASAEELLGRARLAAAASAPSLQIGFLYAASRRASRKLRIVALAELADVLFGSSSPSALTPRAPLASYDLSKLDSGPSVSGGLLSLLFIGSRGSTQSLAEVQTQLGNGQRALAILKELRRLAPRHRATQRLTLRAVKLYRSYGLHREATRLARSFMRANPRALELFEVGFLCANSYLDLKQHRQADRLFRTLLETAQRRADDTAYRRVLATYVNALVAAKRDLDAVKVYYQEVTRRPDDAELLDRFLSFLEQRNLYRDLDRVYHEAARRLGTGRFYARIARYYLRRRRVQEFTALSEQLVRSLGDEEVEAYLRAAAYLQLKGSYRERRAFQRQRDTFFRALYRKALRRFPLDPRFVQRVMESLRRQKNEDEWRRLMVRYAVLDATHADEFLRWRASKHLLGQDLDRLAPGRNTVERILYARALVLRSRYEEALPATLRVLRDFPADRELVKRAAELHNSLAQPIQVEAARHAARLLDGYLATAPADEKIMTRAGDILSEAGLLKEARVRYERIVKLRPADASAHLRLATVYWDYYLFKRSAATIERVRRLKRDPNLFAEKLAAVYESAKERPRAVREYVRISWSKLDRTLGVVSQGGEDEPDGEEYGEGEEYYEEQEGADEAPAAVRQRSPRAEQVTARLLYLGRRHRLRGTIDAAFRAAIKASRGDPRPAVAYARYLMEGERAKEARQVWLTAVTGSSDRFLLQRAVIEGREMGAEGSPLVIAALRRLVTLARGAPEQVGALGVALEAAGQIDQAAATYTDLAARLRGGEALEPAEVADAEGKLADLYLRATRLPEAIAARQRAAAVLPRSPQGRLGPRERIELTLVQELAQAQQLDQAVALTRALHDHLAGDPRPTVALASIHWGRDDREAAVRVLKEALKGARQVPRARRQAFIHGVRVALIDRLKSLRRHREVVDHSIERINREPTNRTLVDNVITYARAHGGLDRRLLDYYTRTSATSFKDRRWPVLLAWIHERRGQPREAAREYGRALEIAPGRLDLVRAQAEAYLAARMWLEAAGAYRKLYELNDRQRSYLPRVAEMYGRGGRADDARRTVAEMVKGSGNPSEYVTAAQTLERLGMVKEAHGYAESALKVLLELPRRRTFSRGAAETLARLSVRVGSTRQAYERLTAAAKLVKEDSTRPKNRASYHERSLARLLTQAAELMLPKEVARYGLEADRAVIRELVRRRLKDQDAADDERRLVEMARAAGLPDLERQVYETLLAQKEQPRRMVQAVSQHLSRRGQATALAAFLEQHPKPDGVERAAQLATAYRNLGDEARETKALGRYLEELATAGSKWRRGPFARRSPLVRRYLTLLRRQQRRDDLRRVASKATSFSAQVAEELLVAGDRELALVALPLAATGKPPVWLEVKRAVALRELGETGPAVRRPLQKSLGVAPIGTRLGSRPDRRHQLVSERAFGYLALYGEMMAGVERPAVWRRYLRAVVEQRPRKPGAYEELGDRLLALGEARLAEDAYRRALALRPREERFIDKQAQAIHQGGDTRRALAVWRTIITRKGATSDDHLYHARALVAAGLKAEGRRALAAHVRTMATRLPDRTLLTHLRALRGLYDHHGARSPWDRYLGALLQRQRRLPLLAAAAGVGEPKGGLVDVGARGPYLTWGLTQLRQSTDVERRWRWRLAHLRWLTVVGRGREVGPLVVRYLPEAKERSSARVGLLVERERAAIRLGDLQGAVSRLIKTARKTEGKSLFTAAVKLLEEEQQERAATEMTAAMLTTQVEAGREDRGTLGGLADALLKLGRHEEALAHLGRLIVRQPDDVASQRLAAEILERHHRYADARGPRTTLAELRRDDAENLVALARDEINSGLWHQGVARALGLLQQRGMTRTAKREATAALLEAARGDPRRAARIAARVDTDQRHLEEPAAVAFARLRRLGARDDDEAREVLERVVRRQSAPGEALEVLGDIALAQGRYAEAARLLERARYYQGETPRLRRLAFWALRGAGRTDAALLALSDSVEKQFLARLPRWLKAPKPVGDKALWNVGKTAAEALAADGGNAVVVAKAAVEVAQRLGDDERALYYQLALARAKKGPHREVGKRLRVRLRRAAERRQRRRLTADFDETTRLRGPWPTGQASATPPSGR